MLYYHLQPVRWSRVHPGRATDYLCDRGQVSNLYEPPFLICKIEQQYPKVLCNDHATSNTEPGIMQVRITIVIIPGLSLRWAMMWHLPHQTSSTYTKPVPLPSFPVTLGEVKGRDPGSLGIPTPGFAFCRSPSQTQPGAPGVHGRGYFPWQEPKPDLRDTGTHQWSQLMSLIFP